MLSRETSAVPIVWVSALLTLVCCGCGLFPASPDRLLARARTAPAAEDRREALLELSGRTSPQMREDLEAILTGEQDAAARAVAAQLLGQLGDAEAADVLRESVRRDSVTLVRQRALEALAGLTGAQAESDLRDVLSKDAEPEMRAAAVALAGTHLGREQAVALLLEALGERRKLPWRS